MGVGYENTRNTHLGYEALLLANAMHLAIGQHGGTEVQAVRRSPAGANVCTGSWTAYFILYRMNQAAQRDVMHFITDCLRAQP